MVWRLCKKEGSRTGLEVVLAGEGIKTKLLEDGADVFTERACKQCAAVV
jgi:hypothetical protein